MKNDPVQIALAQLDSATPAELEKALSSKWNLVIAKAARMAAESPSPLAAGALAKALQRLLARGAELDKGCTAMVAIARALVALECDDPELFRRGMRHVQMEPVWGGSEDTAAELRSTCCLGLANTHDPNRLRDLVPLLADAAWPARAGAARAIAVVGSEAAALLLRLKAILGDQPEVLSECLNGLILIERAEALPLVMSIANSRDVETSETALLALGTCRRPDALELLLKAYESARDPERAGCILLALSSSRLDEAFEFLLDVVRNGPSGRAGLAAKALAIHRGDARLHEAVRAAQQARGGVAD